MAQIAPTTPGLAASLGTGISSGLEHLAALRLQELAQRSAYQNRARSYQGFGLSPDESLALASLPEKSAAPIILSYLERGGLQPQAQENFGPMEQLQQPQIKAPELETRDLLNLLAQPALGNLGLINKQEQISPQAQQQLIQAIQPAVAQQKAQVAPESARSQAKRAERASLKEVLSRPSKAETAKEQMAVRKETQPLVDKLTHDKEFAEFSDSRINKMENLVKKGSLPIASFYSLFKNLEEKSHKVEGAGIGAAAGFALGGPVGAGLGAALGGIGGSLISPIGTLLKYAQRKTSPDAEEFEKLSSEFIKGAKALFGNRITDADLNAFLAQIPTLANTDHGKLQIIKNMKISNKIAKEKYKAMQQIIKENGNRRPIDLSFQIEERSKPIVDKLTEEFETV